MSIYLENVSSSQVEKIGWRVTLQDRINLYPNYTFINSKHWKQNDEFFIKTIYQPLLMWNTFSIISLLEKLPPYCSIIFCHGSTTSKIWLPRRLFGLLPNQLEPRFLLSKRTYDPPQNLGAAQKHTCQIPMEGNRSISSFT